MPVASAAPQRTSPAPTTGRRRAALVLTGALLLLLTAASLALGSRTVPLHETSAAFTAYDATNDLHLVVRELRVPRTALVLLVGVALGLSGAVLQAVTRNPLAEPGLLGVSGGAAAAIVVGIAFFGATTVAGYVWFGFAGAGAAAVAVFLLGRAHDAGTNPVRLVLAGAALSIVLAALTHLVVLNTGDRVLQALRQWMTGSFQGRGAEVVPVVAGAVLVGALVCVAVAPGLNAMSLGQDLATALGLDLRRTVVLATVAVLVLAGAATAAAGPVAFLGLAAPHAARLVVGPDQRRVLPASAMAATVLLLVADVAGRLVDHPQEVGAGVMAALVGGPVFVALARRRRFVRL